MRKKLALLVFALWTLDAFGAVYISITPYAKKGYSTPPPWLSQRIIRTC